MTLISGPTEGVSTDRYNLTLENSSPQEAPIVADQPQMSSGETESRMKSEEVLQKALSPHLKLLQREQSLIAQFKTLNHAHEKFPLAVELFKISVEKFKTTGMSVQEFSSEFKERLKNNMRDPFEGAHSDLKTDLSGTYLHLRGLADEIRQAKDLPYTSPWLQLFELEKETGFSIQGILHLQKEYLESKSIVDEQLKKTAAFFNFKNWLYSWVGIELDSPELAQFYRETFIPNSQKIISWLEKEGDLAALKTIVESYLKVVIDMHPLCPPFVKDPVGFTITGGARHALEEYARFQQHPFILSLPTIAKYASPEAVELAIPFLESYLLVLFYCEKAEIMAPINQEQAQHYLKLAEKETHSVLWFVYGSSQHLQKKQAQRRVSKVKAKIKGS